MITHRTVTAVDDVTQLLARWSGGDEQALDELMPLVYDELRRLASNYLRRERKDHTLQPTALVHEAYLKLVTRPNLTWQNRAQFYGLAAKVMRNILVDHARTRNALKRGGETIQVTLSEADHPGAAVDLDVLALEEAMKSLEEIWPSHGKVVEMRFYGGLTIEETAAALGMSHATVEREWTFARAWLNRRLGSETTKP